MENISQTMVKAKRPRLNPIRRWTLDEEKMLLEFLGENRDFEKPTAQLFYKRLLDEKIIDVNWKLVRAKVRNMRTNYNKTKSWENSTGAGSMDGAALKSTLLRKCPYYFEFDDIFGGRFNSSTVSEEGLDTPGDDYMERDSHPTPPESSVEDTSQPQPTTSRKGIYSTTGVFDIMTTHNALIKLRTDKMAQESAARDREIILKEKELELKKREVVIKEMEVVSRENIERERLQMEERSVARCSISKLYDLCWCLYLCAKNEEPSYNMDIVTSFHLLLCCIDLIYLNVLAENRLDLVNPAFGGIPEKWSTKGFEFQQLQSHCIIEDLCNLTGALTSDARDMKGNHCKAIFKKLFETKTIHGNEETFLGIISNVNFERNVKSLNSAYEQYILSVGEFDERILLNNPTYRKLINSDVGDQSYPASTPQTPYTRMHSLPIKEDYTEPVTSATNNVKKLKDIAEITGPSEYVRQAGKEALDKIYEKLCQMQSDFTSASSNADTTSRFQMAQSLFFYLLDKILRVETRTKPNIDLNILMETEPFITTLIACCVEIVLSAYQSQMKFPWVLKCFGLTAFHFHKIIEIVVRSHDGVLSRQLIKHLNCIEESCLESLAWNRESPLWDIIKIYGLPTWSEVDVDNLEKRNQPQMPSPNCSAFETFSSTIVSESIRRDLFNSVKEPHDKNDAMFIVKNPLDASRRAASLTIFCRKFYKLAWIRLKELCRELKLAEELHLNKLWTLFEYSITHRTELMRDRHLDQMLMCGIYLYIRVQEIKFKTFMDIMKFYRKQPQAQSSTYREVLIEPAEENGTPPKYRDIIYFYNNIYVKKLTPYALNFSGKKSSQQEVPLSPHPTEKQSYPRKLSSNLIVISKMEKTEHSHSPVLTYEFSKSPGKNLEDLNNVISRGKRNLPFNDLDGSDGAIIESKIPKKTPIFLQKCREVLQDRQEQN